MVLQKEFTIPAFKKGFHLITHHIEREIEPLPLTGLVNIFIKHTSAGLSLNENADPSVRNDFENFFNKLIPENHPVYSHLSEGGDDMPAHIKSSLFGAHISVPVTNGRLNLGVWQGIYLCEFRRNGGPRTIIVTIYY